MCYSRLDHLSTGLLHSLASAKTLYMLYSKSKPSLQGFNKKKETKQYFTELDIPALATLFFFFELITKSH